MTSAALTIDEILALDPQDVEQTIELARRGYSVTPTDIQRCDHPACPGRPRAVPMHEVESGPEVHDECRSLPLPAPPTDNEPGRAQELREMALGARASRQKAGIAYNSIQVSIDDILTLTEPPTNDEREALASIRYTIHGGATLPDGVFRVGYPAADAILASPEWRNRHRGPITDEMVETALNAWLELTHEQAEQDGWDAWRHRNARHMRAALQAALDVEGTNTVQLKSGLL